MDSDFNGMNRMLRDLTEVAMNLPDYYLSEHEYKGIPYAIKETEIFGLNLWLSGIKLPQTTGSTREIFYPLLRYLKCEARDEQGRDFAEACYVRPEGESFIPFISIQNKEDGHVKAKVIIDYYLKHKEGIEKVLEEICEINRDSEEDLQKFREKFNKEFVLEFL